MVSFLQKYNCLIYSIICYIIAILFIFCYIDNDSDVPKNTSRTVIISSMLIGTFFLVIHYIFNKICKYNIIGSNSPYLEESSQA